MWPYIIYDFNFKRKKKHGTVTVCISLILENMYFSDITVVSCISILDVAASNVWQTFIVHDVVHF